LNKDMKFEKELAQTMKALGATKGVLLLDD
jgi:hypothetical protein